MGLDNLKKAADTIRLREAEKNSMRASIFGMPASAPSAPSPYFYFNFQFIQTRILAPLVVVLLVGTSTAYAAEGALPGDVLYPVKIYVNENVVEALALSPVKRAEVHASLAERRVVEAQTLAAAGRLDATTTAALAVNLETHIVEAEAEAEAADQLESGKGREVKEKLAATLETGGAILAELGKGSDEDTKENSAGLAVRVIARAESADRESSRVRSKSSDAADASVRTMALSAQESDPAAQMVGQKATASLQLKAAEALKEAHELFAALEGSLDASMTARIEKEFSNADISMSVGSALAGISSYDQAEEHFTAALRLATKLSALLRAHQKFDGDLIVPLLNIQIDTPNNDAEAEVDATIELHSEVEIKVLR